MAIAIRTVDDYLAAQPPGARATLEKLRKAIRAAAPEAEEVISYRIPTFKLGSPLVAFAGFKDHCGFYLMSTGALRAHAADLKGYELNKGSIRFAIDKPLPAALVKKLVQTRIAENEARGNAKAAKKIKGNSGNVDALMEALDHPLKAEVQAVREIIKGVDKRITEEWKWPIFPT